MSNYTKTLPDDPAGFTRRCAFHLSYEHNRKRCGRAVYEIVDPSGEIVPIAHCYDTGGKSPYNGYFVEGCDTCFKKWADAVAEWNSRVQKDQSNAD